MKILVVDNNRVVLAILADFIIGLGHETQTAPDGLSALHLLEEFTPDVVITDLVMPNISGEKLCRIIRELPRLNGCFIIILSAIAAEEKARATCEADAWVAKGKAGEVKRQLRLLLERAGERKSDTLYDDDLTLELDRPHDREVTRELLNSRNYFADIVDHLDEGIFGLSREGWIIYVNRAATRLAGLTEEELLARDFPVLFAENDQAVVRRGLQEVCREEGIQPPRRIDNDPPLILNGYFVALTCRAMEVEGQRTLVVQMQDQSAQTLNLLYNKG